MVSDQPQTLFGTARALAPFMAAAILAWSLALVAAHIDWNQYALSGALAMCGGVLSGLAMRRDPTPRFGVAPGALVFLAAVALLRNSVGATNSGVSALALIPVFQTALYSRSRRELAVVVAGVGILYLAPILIVGPPTYPHNQYRGALESMLVSSVVGFATQRLVARVHTQATEAEQRGQMLQGLTDVLGLLFDSPEPRAEVCRAARSISGATVALLCEPDGDGGLRCTASDGVPAALGGVAPAHSAVNEAFATGRAVHCVQDIERRIGRVDLWESAGKPQTVLLQPLLRHGAILGVLALGWPGRVPAGDTRASVAALLAHEAAAVIARADAMHTLADEAQTDALTGLPNRRAWDAELERAANDEDWLAVAMLDFDNFKQFNDTNGHPAGDRLLKETAAAWRDQLRAGDLLARLGGDEFGLLLRNCDATTIAEVTERLRRSVSNGGTCSAGVAVGAPGESSDAVVARADQALYEAKAGGRDRVHVESA